MPEGREEGEEGGDSTFPEAPEEYDVIIVGGGAAGIGVGIALAHAGVLNFLIVDRGSDG